MWVCACHEAVITCIWNQSSDKIFQILTSCFQIPARVSPSLWPSQNQSLPTSLCAKGRVELLHQLSASLLKIGELTDSHSLANQAVTALCWHHHPHFSLCLLCRRMWRVTDCRPERCHRTINGWLRLSINHRGSTGQVSHSGFRGHGLGSGYCGGRGSTVRLSTLQRHKWTLRVESLSLSLSHKCFWPTITAQWGPVDVPTGSFKGYLK